MIEVYVMKELRKKENNIMNNIQKLSEPGNGGAL